jgi:hypothetical protein
VCQNSGADGGVQAVEVYVQLSPSFSLSDLRLLVGRNHVEVVEKVPPACWPVATDLAVMCVINACRPLGTDLSYTAAQL